MRCLRCSSSSACCLAWASCCCCLAASSAGLGAQRCLTAGASLLCADAASVPSAVDADDMNMGCSMKPACFCSCSQLRTCAWAAISRWLLTARARGRMSRLLACTLEAAGAWKVVFDTGIHLCCLATVLCAGLASLACCCSGVQSALLLRLGWGPSLQKLSQAV